MHFSLLIYYCLFNVYCTLIAYSVDLNYPDKAKKSENFKRISLKLDQD